MSPEGKIVYCNQSWKGNLEEEADNAEEVEEERWPFFVVGGMALYAGFPRTP